MGYKRHKKEKNGKVKNSKISNQNKFKTSILSITLNYNYLMIITIVI